MFGDMLAMGAGDGSVKSATGTITFSGTSDQQTIQTGLNKIGTFLIEKAGSTLMMWDSSIDVGSGTGQLSPNRCLVGYNSTYATRAVGTAYSYTPIPVSKPTTGDITLYAPNNATWYTGTFTWKAYEEVTS